MGEPKAIDPQLAKILESFGAAVAKAEAENPSPEPKPLAKIYQFPRWPEAAPGMPNPVIRSALFPAIKSKDRQWLKREKIAAPNGVEIIYSGQQWNQQDFDVALTVFNLARNHPLGTVCHTSAHGLLKKLGLGTGQPQHHQLHETLIRLCNTFEITDKTGRFNFFGSFIVDGLRDNITKQYTLTVNPKIAALFARGWTQIDFEIRRKLRGKDLALWLQTQYASHRDPYPYSVEKLRELSGSRTARLRRFRDALRAALAELQASGAIAGWAIDTGDLVHVYKTPTITQRRTVPQLGRK
jgi:hypothetical protein